MDFQTTLSRYPFGGHEWFFSRRLVNEKVTRKFYREYQKYTTFSLKTLYYRNLLKNDTSLERCQSHPVPVCVIVLTGDTHYLPLPARNRIEYCIKLLSNLFCCRKILREVRQRRHNRFQCRNPGGPLLSLTPIRVTNEFVLQVKSKRYFSFISPPLFTVFYFGRPLKKRLHSKRAKRVGCERSIPLQTFFAWNRNV